LSDIKKIIQVDISRQTRALSQASFSVYAIMSEFITTKTTVTFDRHRFYADLDEMLADGWVVGDEEYKAAQKLLSQGIVVDKFMIGRKDSADADWTAALAAIYEKNSSWLGFMIVADSATEEDDYKLAAAWAETKKVLYFYSSSEAGIITSGTSDVAAFMKTQNYDYTVSIYSPNSQGDTTTDYIESAWPGKVFPHNTDQKIGRQNWIYKTLGGVSAYDLSSDQETNVASKNCNYYLEIEGSGTQNTLDGRVASGEWIDIIIGTKWIETRLQESCFGLLKRLSDANDKLGFDDAGIVKMAGIVEGVLTDAVTNGILAEGSVVITYPKAADVSEADKISRFLPDIKFTANYRGAINSTAISGVISV